MTSDLLVFKRIGLALHSSLLVYSIITLFMGQGTSFGLLLLIIPQFILFKRGLQLQSKFVVSQKYETTILDNFDLAEDTTPIYNSDYIESPSFQPVRLWSLIFSLLSILLGAGITISYYIYYGLIADSYLILIKMVRNWCLFFGGISSVIYLIFIRFFLRR